jgi:gamma-glutamyltranspeptidase/glutathione hydrolase
MTPTIVLDADGDVFLVTGSPGGSRIITTTLQVILNVIEHGLDIATATVEPRVHHQWLPDELRVEHGISKDTIRLLETMGHVVSLQDAMGATQSIHAAADGRLHGASDPRRPTGLAAGH